MDLKRIRGTNDLIGEQLNYHEYVVNTAKDNAEKYCYIMLETPIIEDSTVFHRTLGETSDIVSKETYTFLDRDKTSITLRPEFTAAIVRAFINGGFTQSIPVKFFSHGPAFRHERPQKGRYRQFHQINFESFGALTPNSDAEIITLSYDILKALSLIDNTQLEINTLGDIESRKLYKKLLTEYFLRYENDLSDISKLRLKQNPLRILDSKDLNEKKIIKGAPKLEDVINLESKKYYYQMLENLDILGIDYKKNHTLVRGLDYYTHTVFEFTTDLLGSQGAVFAGGRYDGLVKLMGGPDISAIGFAGGIERLVELLKLKKALNFKKPFVYLVPIGESAQKYAIEFARDLRNSGFIVNMEFGMKLKKHMQRADKQNASYALIFGDDELSQNKLKIKHMKTGEIKELNMNEVSSFLSSNLN